MGIKRPVVYNFSESDAKDEMLPDDFWEKFETKLDKMLDVKLDKMLDVKLDKMLDVKLDKRLDKLEKKINQVIDWTQRQDRCIERELTEACFDHFKRVYPGYIAVKPHKSVIGGIIKDQATGLHITDFDGVVVLTNDRDYAMFLDGTVNTMRFDKQNKAYLVIVEAKQHVTKKKVDAKIRQREKIVQVRSSLPSISVVDPFIGLYVGGADIDEAASERIQLFLDEHAGQQLVGMVRLNGARFSVLDVRNNFGRSDVVYGGRNRKR